MIEPAAFHAALQRNGFSFFTGVPDSLLKDLCAYITDHVPPADHVINANEGSAVALAAGYHLATGGTPVVYLQNSGTGNAVNPLLSLADPSVYAIPMLLLIGWRGEPGVKDEPQHVTQGRVQERLLDAMEVPYRVVDADIADVDRMIAEIADAIRREARPHALLIRKGTFAEYKLAAADDPLPMTRASAIERFMGEIDPDALLVATTGIASREVFDFRERHGQGHDHDFLTVGSMGHASQIALSIAQRLPDRSVWCLDGDGAVIMHMGSLAIIGTQAPANLRHVVINNGAHDSVGGQPTAGLAINIAGIALACGYRGVATVTSAEELTDALHAARDAEGPSLLEVRVSSDPHTDAGRPTTTPAENKAAFMRALDRDAL